MNNAIKIVFFGTPDFVIPVLKTLHDNFKVIAVITTPDALLGRKKILTPTPVKKFAIDHNITCFDIENLEQFKEQNDIDFLVVAAYGQIIPKRILDLPKYGALNIHPSLLPKYRGPSPIQTALLAGEKENGITIIEMDEEIDHGPIITQIPFDVSPTDTFESLHTKMFQRAADSLPEVISKLINKSLTPIPQNHNKATFTQRITKNDGFFELDRPPSTKKIEQMINAFHPWPNAWTKIKIKDKEFRLKFLPENFVQLEGGKKMKLKEFFNGHPELKEKIEALFTK